MKSEHAIILLSGGLDSTTCIAIAKEQGYTISALSFFYGQRNVFEIDSAKKIAEHYGITEHLCLDLPLGAVGGSSLTTSAPLEENRSMSEIGNKIPSTYVPARNTLFLSYALAWADALSCTNIFIGVNAVDTSGYPDCRPEFIAAFETLANLATKTGTEDEKHITIQTPLQELSKAEIIKKGLSLKVPYELTNTCYNPDQEGMACGICDACQLRKQGFIAAQSIDPLKYQHQ